MEDLDFENIKMIEEKQWQLLKQQLAYAAANSPYYSELFEKLDIKVEKISNFNDFSRIPITTKEDLQLRNSDFISIPQDEIIDYVTTSGTLGSPVNFALNEADLERLAQNEYKSFKQVGVTRQDKVQITTTLDRRFMAGMAYFLGLRKLGGGIIRTGSGSPELQWESIQRFQPNYLVAVPSFLLKMIRYAEENNIDYKNSSVKAAICIGEPLRDHQFQLNALGKKITESWDIELFSTYASTEMSTAFTECKAHKGNHVFPDLIYPEVIKENGEPAKAGETGELVVTPLGTQTMPLLRFATGDIVTYLGSSCDCGRNTPRLGAVIGRKQQKIKLKGTSLYPQHIIEVMNAFGRIDSFVIEAAHDELGNDLLKIYIPDSFSQMEELREFFKSRINVTPQLELIERKEIEKLKFPKSSRKPQIFRDLR